MIDQGTLIAYMLIVLGFVFIPGPATLLTVARATTSGTRVGVATGAGIAMGDVLHATLAIVGISAIVAASALLFSIVKYLGAAYLIYLGICAILAKAPAADGAPTIPMTAATAFRQAVVAEVLNPKTGVFFLAFLPQFVHPENGPVAAQLATLGALFVLLGMISTITYAMVAGRLGDFLRRKPAMIRWQSRMVGAIYCGVGIRLALQER